MTEKINQKEKRMFVIRDLLASSDDKESIIEGHAAVFNSKTNIYGLWDEIIEPDAFKNTDFRDVLFSINHDLNKIPLARSRNNNANSTLQLAVDEKGLYIKAKLDTDNNSEAKSLYSSIQRGDIDGMSFIFICENDEWDDLDKEMPIRRIKSISKVIEVSAVNFPAYEDTDINARAVEPDGLNATLENVKADYLNKKQAEERQKKLETLKILAI